jgi:hypothetical protein
MSNLEPMRSQSIQSRHTRSTRTHQIEISDAPELNRKQLAREFAAMTSAPPRGTARIAISVDSGELICIMPHSGKVVTCLEHEQREVSLVLAGRD